MDERPNELLGERAEQQLGVFTLRDADSVGIGEGAIRDRVATGRYERVYPGVFAVRGSVRDLRRQLSAAVRSMPALAGISHHTAAEMWGLTSRGTRRIDVVTRRWDRVHRPDLRVHESLDLMEGDVVDLDGVPVTTAVRTVVDLGAVNKWLVEAALEEGIRRRLFSLEDVEAFVKRVGRRGRRGVGVIRPLLEARRRWDTTTDSALEDRFRRVLAEFGCPDPVPQYEVVDDEGRLIARVDFAYPAASVAIELDSERYHMDRITFRGDRRKQNQAVVIGWTLLRYTWWDVVEEPWRVCNEITAALT